ARNLADRIWLREVFAAAKTGGAMGVVLLTQANPGFDLADPTRTEIRDPKTFAEADKDPDGFSDYLLTDKPLQDAKGQRVENFTRLETYGDNAQNGNNDVHWVKLLIDTASR